MDIENLEETNSYFIYGWWVKYKIPNFANLASKVLTFVDPLYVKLYIYEDKSIGIGEDKFLGI
jgi:hypothetical protein